MRERFFAGSPEIHFCWRSRVCSQTPDLVPEALRAMHATFHEALPTREDPWTRCLPCPHQRQRSR